MLTHNMALPNEEAPIRMKSFTFALFAFTFALFSPGVSHAASLYFFPESAVKTAGADFTVSVYANSSDQSMNAVSGVIEFPPDRLEVVSLIKTNSIVNVWVQEPSFSNQDGRIRFEGVVLNPGFQGGTGRLLAITFRPKSAGTATLKFSSGSILANDGEGTNILRTMGGANYTLKADAQAGFPEKKEEPVAGKQANSPLITSATHPLEEKWYNNKKLQLAWDIPGGTDGVSYALEASPSFQLVPQGKGLISNVQYDVAKFKDGVWYFYLRFHTPSGWGPVGKRMVRMDFTPPTTPSLARLNSDDPTNPRPIYTWESHDAFSGVVKYDVKIGDGNWSEVRLDTDKGYELPLQAPGERQLAVRAFDEAGNYSDAGTVFSVEPIPAPTIEEYSKSFIPRSEALALSGRAIADAAIRLFLRKEGSEAIFETKALGDGSWAAEFNNKLASGEWSLSAIAIDERGGQSLETAPVQVTAVSPWVKAARSAAQVFSVLGFTLITLGTLLGFAYLTFGRSVMYRFQLRHDFTDFKSKVRTELKALEGDLEILKQSGKMDPSVPAFREVEKRLKGELARLVEDVRREAKLLD
jgi:hypothetical protein